MKLWAYLIMLSFNFSYADVEKKSEFQVYQTNKNTDISSLEAPKNYLKDLKKEKKKLSRTERDYFLEKYIPVPSSKMDELDRDLFIQRTIHYREKDFLKNYSQIISKDKYLKLKNDLRFYQ